MFQIVETGHGILIPEQAVDSNLIRRELKRLDPQLRLVREFSRRHQAVVWVVQHQLGENHAVPVFRWTDPDGTPRPLSSGLLEVFKSQEARGRLLYAAVDERNRRRQERIDQDVDDAIDDIAADIAPRLRGAKSAPPVRGQYLRIARDKQRARGRNV